MPKCESGVAANTLLAFDEAAAAQIRQRFADRVAADIVATAEFRLRRQKVAYRDRAVFNRFYECLCELSKKCRTTVCQEVLPIRIFVWK